MKVFDHYARYYDLLYRDKDYPGEARFVAGLIREHAPNASTILELGCGTGIHASLLAEAGYHVHGVDRSSEMLERARARLTGTRMEADGKLSFSQEDVRSVRTGEMYDVIISLFHVLSYQTTNEDLLATMETAQVHLKTGGIFIFDCWYGPAVLTQKPEVRVKRFEDDVIAVTRIAQPATDPNANIVDVNYDVLIKDKKNSSWQEIKETHRMRYLFKPELEYYLSSKGMTIEKTLEWMTGREPGFNTWGVCFVARSGV